jgi:hypothetical protein
VVQDVLGVPTEGSAFNKQYPHTEANDLVSSAEGRDALGWARKYEV